MRINFISGFRKYTTCSTFTCSWTRLCNNLILHNKLCIFWAYLRLNSHLYIFRLNISFKTIEETKHSSQWVSYFIDILHLVINILRFWWKFNCDDKRVCVLSWAIQWGGPLILKHFTLINYFFSLLELLIAENGSTFRRLNRK